MNIETSNLSAREIEFLEDLDTSMCALVTLNLSLVHPSSSQNRLTVRVPPAHSSLEVRTQTHLAIRTVRHTIPSSGHSHSDSLAGIPSMSSLGRIIKPSRRNPFGYAATVPPPPPLPPRLVIPMCENGAPQRLLTSHFGSYIHGLNLI